MRDALREGVERLVKNRISVLKGFETKGREVKRVVLYNSVKLTRDNQTEMLNHTSNRFLNQQYKIDHPEIKVVVESWYNPKRHKQEGDYAIDVGECLRGVGAI